MSGDHAGFSSESFSGRVRLFPLPNLVMFPHVLRPLHIFEPRYRQLLEDALAADGLIAVAMLAPGWEGNYEGRPRLEPAACLCSVAAHHRLDDGAYNLLVHGRRRVRLVEELPTHRLYREAAVELIEDAPPQVDAEARLRRDLLSGFRALAAPAHVANAGANFGQTAKSLDDMMRGDLPLGALTDVVAYTLDLETSLKVSLLGEHNVVHRAQLLVDRLADLLTPAPGREFPVRISWN